MSTSTTAPQRFHLPLITPTPAAHPADRSVALLFWLWLGFRTLAWTAVAATQPNPPLDTVEWLCWGNQWQLGYHKHPPLPAWVAEAAFRVSGGSFAVVYLAGYLFLAIALFSVWRLASRLLPPRAALAATMCLDGLVFLGPTAMEYNNHLPLIAFWSLSIWLFHRAVENDRWRDWLGLGAAFGLALLCKHTTLFLIAPLLAYWLWHNGLRRWSRPALVALVAVLIVLPHFVWLWQNDFPTLRWVRLRTAGDSGALDHRASAALFLLGQLVRLVPVVLVLLPVLCSPLSLMGEGLGVRGAARNGKQPPPSPPAPLPPKRGERSSEGLSGRSFLLVAVLGPVVLHLAASLVFGAHLRDIWGAPLWTFFGLLVVLLVQTDDSDRAWRRLQVWWAAVTGFTLLAALFATDNVDNVRRKPARTNYPGRQLYKKIAWGYEAQFGVPPAVVAGDWWLAANICVHSPHRPVLYGSLEPAFFGLSPDKVPTPERFLEPDPMTAPWTSDADLNRRGGVLVWDARAFGDDLPLRLRSRFPQAQVQPAVVLRCHGASFQDLRVGWAAIPPSR